MSEELPPFSERTRADRIRATVDDMASGLLYDDRKEDEDLPRGAIEEAVKAGEITAEEIVSRFEKILRASLEGS